MYCICEARKQVMAAITIKIIYLLFKINRESLDQKSIRKNFCKGIKIVCPAGI
jgi:hypothetical protein